MSETGGPLFLADCSDPASMKNGLACFETGFVEDEIHTLGDSDFSRKLFLKVDIIFWSKQKIETQCVSEFFHLKSFHLH